MKLVVRPDGQRIFADNGQPPIASAAGRGDVLDEVQGMVGMDES